MPTLVDLEGFEHGVLSTAGGGLFSSITGGLTVDAAGALSGAYGLTAAYDGSEMYVQRNSLGGGGVSLGVGGFRIRVDVGTDSGTRVTVFKARATGDFASGRFMLNSNGEIVARIGSSANTAVVGPNIADGQEHWIDFRLDPAVPLGSDYTMDWRVDGVAQTQVLAASGGSNQFVGWQAGIETDLGPIGIILNPAVAIDDVVISTTSADYPIGKSKVLGYRTSGAGTHNLEASPSAFFSKVVGGTPFALTSAEATSGDTIDDDPITQDDDRIQVAATTSPAQYADPTADGANNAWTKSTGTAGWSLLDDAVRQPTAPSTGTDRITSSTAGQIQDVVLGNTITYAAGLQYKLWIYGSGGVKRAVDVQISVNDGTSWNTATRLILDSAAAAWRSIDISSLITNQTTLDQLRVRLTCASTAGGGGATAVEVDALYVEKPSTINQPSGVNYAEYWMQDSAETTDPIGIRVITRLRSSDTVLNDARMIIVDGANTADVFAVSIGSTSDVYKDKTYGLRLDSSAWTDAAFDSLKFRLTSAGDADPDVRFMAFVVQAVFADVSTSTPKSGSDANGTTTENFTLIEISTTTDANGTVTEVLLQRQSATDVNGATTEAQNVAVSKSGSDNNGTVTEVASVKITVTDNNGTTTEINAPRIIVTGEGNGTATETLSNRISVTDQNGATIEAQAIAVPVSSSDANGATTENALLVFSTIATDGNAATTETLSVRISVTDQNGTTTEQAQVPIFVNSSDSNGTTTEAFTIRVTVTDQNGATTENNIQIVVMSVADTNGATTETGTASTAVNATDNNSTTTEVFGPLRLVPAAAETNGWTENQTLVFSALSTDTNGTTTEFSSTATFKTGTDNNGATTETASARVFATATDTGTDNEAATLTVTYIVTDANGATTENSVRAVSTSSQDSGTSTEAQALAARPTASESGTAAEAQALAARPSSTDTGSGTETFTRRFVTFDQNGATTETQATVISYVSDENGTSTEISTLTAISTTTDFGQSSEDQDVTLHIIITDTESGMLLSAAGGEARITSAGAESEIVGISATRNEIQHVSADGDEATLVSASYDDKPHITEAR